MNDDHDHEHRTPPAPSPGDVKFLATQARRESRQSRFLNVMIALILAFGVWASTTSVGLQREVKASQDEAAERGRVNRELLLQIRGLVEFTDSLGTPDERAEQTQALIDSLAARVDCNTRLALLDAIGEVFGDRLRDEYSAKVEVLCPGPLPPTGG